MKCIYFSDVVLDKMECSREIIFTFPTWYSALRSGFKTELLWKKSSKKEINENTSETINKIIPHSNPFNCVFFLKSSLSINKKRN